MSEENNNFDDNQFEEYRDAFQDEPAEEPGGEPPSGGGRNNRPFIIAIALIGGIFLLAVIGLVVYILLNSGAKTAQVQEDTAQINAENTAIALQATDLYRNEVQLLTEKAIPSATLTATSVIAVPTNTHLPTATQEAGGVSDPERTQTVSAFLTSVAQGTPAASGTPAAAQTAAATSTALPTTGIMDDIGFPGLLAAAVLLIIIVFVARRMRLSTQ